VLAGPGNELIDDARSLLATFDLPSLPFNTATLPQVPEPGSGAVSEDVAAAARAGVVQVSATSSRCGLSQVGSGVVMAPERVVTNAHVITGSGGVTVRTSGEARTLAARLVEVDRVNDVAVLYVPGLAAPALEWADDTSRGTQGGVAGYPGGGRLMLGAARVRGSATVADQSGGGVRRVLVFRGMVRPGNSGGALLDESGDVMGVVFANSSVDADTGFALTRAEVRPALARGARATEEVSSGSCPAG
jgi:S1-C subfamily serine protease